MYVRFICICILRFFIIIYFLPKLFAFIMHTNVINQIKIQKFKINTKNNIINCSRIVAN